MIHKARHTKSRVLPLALAVATGMAAGSLRAQPNVVQPAQTAAAGSEAAMPPLPHLTSPVDQFRELLALPPSARESHLTNRPPEIRKRILGKLREYDAMKADDRELLLRSTQLRWYLLVFMEIPPDKRASQLAEVPETDRRFVETHLGEWDLLPKDEQNEILKYQNVIENLLARGFTNAAFTTNVISGGFQNLDAFLKLPLEQRQQMYDNFQRFFELSDAEKQKTLGEMPPQERMLMAAAMKRFSQLPAPLREQCLKSFSKFSSMSAAEREEFLKNAERWRELTPAERQAWREVVFRVRKGPPLPQLIAPLPPPLPPPPLPSQHRPSLQVNNSQQTNSSQ